MKRAGYILLLLTWLAALHVPTGAAEPQLRFACPVSGLDAADAADTDALLDGGRALRSAPAFTSGDGPAQPDPGSDAPANDAPRFASRDTGAVARLRPAHVHAPVYLVTRRLRI